MTKLRAILLAIAAALAAGTAFIVAITNEAARQGVTLTCADYLEAANRLQASGLLAAAMAEFTPPACRATLAASVGCWKMASGNLCRNGLEFGPGLGGTQACVPSTATDTPWPCHSDHGPNFGEQLQRLNNLSLSDRASFREWLRRELVRAMAP